MKINAFGKPCPLPLMMAKKELDAGHKTLEIAVDNETAVENLTRLGQTSGLEVAVESIEGGFLVSLNGGNASSGNAANEEVSEETSTAPSPSSGSYAVFVGQDHIGDGSPELGYNLMKMAIFTLSESDDIPSSLLFMNSGVKLVAGEESQVVEHVRSLVEQGTEVLVCGTCLDFYGLKNDLQVGLVSNMYDILESMKKASKVISL